MNPNKRLMITQSEMKKSAADRGEAGVFNPLGCGPCCDLEVDGNMGKGVGDLSWMRVGIALALAGQGMVFGLGYNNALLSGEAPAFGSLPYIILHGALIGSAFAVIGLLGKPLFRSTVEAIGGKRITVEGLFFLSALGAFVGSLISTMTGEGSVYYEVVGIVLVIYTVGRKVGARTRERAIDAVKAVRNDHTLARVRMEDGLERWVSVGALITGKSLVIVNPGEAIPTDGIVVTGVSDVLEVSISGESVPVKRSRGDCVYGGTYALDGSLEIRAEAVGGKRLMDRVLTVVEEALLRPSRIQVEADRVMAWFLPVVLVLSLLTFFGWLYLMEASWWVALFNAMSVLLVACPCAVGLATPIAIWATLLRLSRRGVVSRSGTLIEGLTESDVFIFDKTGTLSEDDLSISGVHITNKSFDEWLIRAYVASLESQVNHPIARCLATLSEERYKVDSLRVVAGSGVEGFVNGCFLRVGCDEWIGPQNKGQANSEVKRLVWVEIEGQLAGSIELSESLRSEGEGVINELKGGGYGVRILTGDPNPVLKSLAGVPIEGNLKPEDKARVVRDLVTEGHRVVFVGDGMNDAGAMAEATVSISMERGDSLVRVTADAVLMGGKLRLIPWAQSVCRSAQLALRGNIRFAVCYNGIGMCLAALGCLHPVVAALLMLLSSFYVSFRAARLVEISD